jgi:AraC family transcriptional regulator of adaptative response / DNA-3-methyladenine glycosylase II
MKGNVGKRRKPASDVNADLSLSAKLSSRAARPPAPHEVLRSNLELDPAFCWQAVYSRDHRFDGLFFAGISSTGVYCRSICPVSFGHPESIHWFQSAAAAEAGGFRPCRRCRPDTAPGSSAWFGTWAVVSRALKLISEGALDGGNLESLADRVGIGSRHLRRLFQRHLGASPLKIARSHRVLVARNLIADTQLPITEIAKGTGFRSIRQFNHSVRTAFGKSPTALRRMRRTPSVQDPLGGIVVHLPYRPPFDWPSLLDFFRSRATPGVESVEGEIYRRTIQIGSEAGAIEVWQEAAESRLCMRVFLPGCGHLMQAVQRARRLFDLGADAQHIGSFLARDPQLANCVEQRPGLRVPGAWDGFEVAILAVLGQTLASAEPAPTIASLIKSFGRPLRVSLPGLTHLFPSPEILASANLERIGIPAGEAQIIAALSKDVVAGILSFDLLKSSRNTALQMQISTGLIEETAAYIAMRALGDPDAFSCTSEEFRSGLVPHRSSASLEEVARIFEGYRPWRAYAAMHYWASMKKVENPPQTNAATRKNIARPIRPRSRAFRRLRSRP